MIIGICHEYGFILVPDDMFIRYMPARFIFMFMCCIPGIPWAHAAAAHVDTAKTRRSIGSVDTRVDTLRVNVITL
jgi:hypothetical protein